MQGKGYLFACPCRRLQMARIQIVSTKIIHHLWMNPVRTGRNELPVLTCFLVWNRIPQPQTEHIDDLIATSRLKSKQ